MGLESLAWEPALLDAVGVPAAMLPAIRSSSEVYGLGVGDLAGVPISGDLGDQQAALFGQACFEPGQIKCTYGTGCFMLMHTGERPVHSDARADHDRGRPARATARPRMRSRGPSRSPGRSSSGCATTSGSSATRPRSRSWPGPCRIAATWCSCPRSPACSRRTGGATRGASSPGLTRYASRGHIARAALESTAYQVYDLGDAMVADLGRALPDELRVGTA